MYVADREQELRQSSMGTVESALGFFKQWCAEEEEIDNLNGLTGRKLHHYRLWRRDEAPTKTDTLSKHSEQTQQKILRRFIRYCEQINAVEPGMHEMVRVPSVPDDEFARSDTVDPDQAREVIQWFASYQYASLEHVVWSLLADTGARIGTLVALDIDDYCPGEEPPYIRVRHRPKTETKLKNGKQGERLVALSEDVCSVIDDYLDNHRPDVIDDYGRDPLLATSRGRIAKGTIRKYVYKWTRSCAVGNECPHGRDLEECEATEASKASKCPTSESPHSIRRGYITHQLSSGVERSYLSGRCDVSDEVLETHYDARDEFAQMEVRRRALDHARRDFSSYGGR
jgi:site-specific recombinase XerD